MVIRTRLMLFMGILSIIVTLVVGFASYKFSEQNAIREAKSKGQIIFNFIYSYREYFKDTQKALILELVEDDRFYPELMSGFVVTRGIWDVFKGHLTGYRFKQATLDPLYPPNKADKEELAMIGRFRSDPSLKQLEGIVKAQGEKFFYMAKPIKIEKKGCLRCHGDPMNAPKDQIEIYGTSNGYNWTHGETVAAFVVYVSMDKALQSAKRSAGRLFLIGISCFLVSLFGFFLIFDRLMIRPIREEKSLKQ